MEKFQSYYWLYSTILPSKFQLQKRAGLKEEERN